MLVRRVPVRAVLVASICVMVLGVVAVAIGEPARPSVPAAAVAGPEPPPATPSTGPRTAQVAVTDPEALPADGSFSDRTVVLSATAGPAEVVVNRAVKFQRVDGFGASITDSSAYVLAGSAQRDALMERLFDPGAGIGISLLRQPIGSSDFTASAFEPFSLEHDRETVLPLLHQAAALQPALHVIASAWSPPPELKTNHSMADGRLLSGAGKAYAAYIAAFVAAYRAEGVTVTAVTPGSEPVSFMAGGAPHLSFDMHEQRAFVAFDLAPALSGTGVRILAYDDNVTHDHPAFAGFPDYVLADPTADGLAAHCYFGSLSYLAELHAQFPDKPLYVTECSSGIASLYDGDMAGMAIEAMRDWASGIVLWNVALDEDGGPYQGGSGGRCTPLVTVPSDGGPPLYRLDYFGLGHFSRYVLPGAVRVQSSDSPSLRTVAFSNPDGSTVLVMRNHGPARPVTVALDGRALAVAMPADGIATVKWPATG
jgi:glucosylceramidase